MKLLTRSNTKTIKGEARGFITFILHLSPGNKSGYEVCGGRSKECFAHCLDEAGMGKFKSVQDARIRKTRWFFEDRKSFMVALVKDVSAAIRYARTRGLTLVIRLNGTSDIPWETIRCGAFKNIMERYPFLTFYDYTKLAGRKKLPSNYHLTFSASEENTLEVRQAMADGMSVAAVFDHVPASYAGFPVINGDEDDLRFLDPPGSVIGLKAKGPAKNHTTTFVIRSAHGTTNFNFPTHQLVGDASHARY